MELNLWLVLFQGSVFLVTLIALNWLIFRPALAYLAERERNIGGLLRNAQLQETEADEREEELSERLNAARSVAREEQAKELAMVRKLEEETHAKATGQANEFLTKEAKRIEQEERLAAKELEKSAVMLAQRMAATILGRGLVLFALLTVSSPAWAAEEAHHASGPPWKWIIYHSINLLLLAVLLRKFLRRPLADFLAGRRAQIVDDLTHAEAVSTEAQARIRVVEERMGSIEEEEAEIRQRIQAATKTEREAREKRAEKMGVEIMEAARVAIGEEESRAQARLRAAVARRAVDLAREELNSAFGSEDDKRLWEESIDSLTGATL